MSNYLAKKLVVDAYNKGEDITLIVLSSAIREYYKTHEVLSRIDIMRSRPINFSYDDEKFELDLCFFNQPQVRCSIYWSDVAYVNSIVTSTTTVLLLPLNEDGLIDIDTTIRHAQRCASEVSAIINAEILEKRARDSHVEIVKPQKRKLYPIPGGKA